MPPKAAPQKRKRGRPSAAPRRSASPDAQGAQQPTYEGDGEDESRPRKRGRPPRNPDADESASPAPAQQQEKRKRGRPSLGKSTATPEKTARRGPGRPPAKAVDASPDAPAETPTETAKSRGRPRKSPETTEDSSAPAQKEKRKPGRPSMGKTTDETPKRQRGRPPRASLQNQAEEEAGEEVVEDVEEAEEQQPAQKVSEQDGRSKKGRKKQQEEPQEDPTRRKQPGKATTTKADKPPAQGAEAPAPSKSKQKRAPGNDGDTSADEEIPRSPSKPYAHVSETLVHIPQATIDAKWSPLNDPSIANATTTLSLAHRPVIQTVATTGRDAQHHAVAALDLVQSRIARKMKKGLPFPPAASSATGALGRRADARGAELDFESVLGGAAALQRQLEPALHAVELLRREKRRAQEELERDYVSLQNLEAGARGQARERKQLLKRAHPLAPESTVSRGEDLEMVFGNKENGGGAVFKDLEDEELRDLAMQLSGHVESMRANLAQVDGIAPRMDAGRAALRSVLLEHLDQATYDQVVLG